VTAGRLERSAGFIVFREAAGGREYLLIRDRKHGNWGFPKGHLEGEEDDLSAARRETREEAGVGDLEPVAGFREEMRYPLRSGRTKTTVLFLAEMPAGESVTPGRGEVVDWAWLPVEGALQRLSFDAARAALRRAAALAGEGRLSRIDYDAVSERYDRSRNFDAEFTRRLLAILPGDFRPARALDVGCGTGNATACLVEAFPGTAVFGLDLSAGMLSKARAKHARLPLVRGCASKLPFIGGKLDLVLSTYVLHHLEHPVGFYAGLERCLSPGGRAVLLTAGHRQIREHFLIRFFPRFGEIDCERFPSLDEVESGLRTAGLEISTRSEIPVAEYAVDRRYLERVRNRHISTFELMDDREFSEGLQALSAWVAAHAGPEEKRPRHTARGTLILARKP